MSQYITLSLLTLLKDGSTEQIKKKKTINAPIFCLCAKIMMGTALSLLSLENKIVISDEVEN